MSTHVVMSPPAVQHDGKLRKLVTENGRVVGHIPEDMAIGYNPKTGLYELWERKGVATYLCSHPNAESAVRFCEHWEKTQAIA